MSRNLIINVAPGIARKRINGGANTDSARSSPGSNLSPADVHARLRLTASGYVQVEKEAVLALIRQEGDHLLELLVPAERHLQERRGVIDDVRIVLRAHRAEGVRQLDAAPRYRRDRGTKP